MIGVARKYALKHSQHTSHSGNFSHLTILSIPQPFQPGVNDRQPLRRDEPYHIERIAIVAFKSQLFNLEALPLVMVDRRVFAAQFNVTSYSAARGDHC
jgi:hypothetical protein